MSLENDSKKPWKYGIEAAVTKQKKDVQKSKWAKTH
mgnify:CR=1 FL=1